MAIGIIVLLVAGMFGYAYMKKKEITQPPQDTPVAVTPDNSAYAGITRIDAKHFFINGTHTLVGEILMPTPCDLLNWTSSIAESMPEKVSVDFAVVNDSEMCAQVVTPQRFKVSFTASEKASITATFMGRPVELNLIPGEKGETPDSFELFIKG